MLRAPVPVEAIQASVSPSWALLLFGTGLLLVVVVAGLVAATGRGPLVLLPVGAALGVLGYLNFGSSDEVLAREWSVQLGVPVVDRDVRDLQLLAMGGQDSYVTDRTVGDEPVRLTFFRTRDDVRVAVETVAE